MSIEDKMTIDERRKYLHTMRKRYVDAKRKERSQLLDEMQAVTAMHCKALIRLMYNGADQKCPVVSPVSCLRSIVKWRESR